MSTLVQTKIPASFRLVARAIAVLAIVLRHSTSLLVRLALRRWRAEPGSRDELLGRALRDLLTSLGPTFVKVGQLLSTRPDLLPAGTISELRPLQDSLPSERVDDVLRVLRESLGSPVGETFHEFETTPVAAASIAQVHRARLRGGDEVAVKVRRPGIAEVMERDLELLRRLARWLGRRETFQRIPLEAAVAQVNASIADQLDFRKEAETNRRLRHGLRNHAGIRLPRLYDDLCTRDVIVMTFESDLRRLDDPALDPERARAAVRLGLHALYEMIFRLGTVHCDLHPGNIFTRDGEVVLLDTGFSAGLSRSDRFAFRDFFMGLVFNDGRQCATILRRTAGWTCPDFDAPAFEHHVIGLVGRYSGVPAGGFQVGRFVVDLFAAQRRFGLCGSPNFTLAILSLLTFEGIAKACDADLDFQREAAPYAALSLIEMARLS